MWGTDDVNGWGPQVGWRERLAIWHLWIISGIFYFIFSDHSWLRNTEIVDKVGEYCNFNMNIVGLKCDHSESYFQVPWASVMTQFIKNLPQCRRISPGEGNGNPLWYSCLKNPMDIGAWQAVVHGVARIGHDLVIEPPQVPFSLLMETMWDHFCCSLKFEHYFEEVKCEVFGKKLSKQVTIFSFILPLIWKHMSHCSLC